MASWILINAVKWTDGNGTSVLLPGRTIDDSVYSVASLQAAGAQLWPANEPYVAAAATLVANMKAAKGINVETMEAIMHSAVGTALGYKAIPTKGADLTDGDETLKVTDGKLRMVPASTLGADRTKTLSATGAQKEDVIRISRIDNSAHQLIVVDGPSSATLLTMAASHQGFAEFYFNGTNWILTDLSVV